MAGRVLVARLDSMGDVLLAGPAVRAVAASADHVTFLAGPRGTAAAHLLPGVDEVIEWNSPWIADPSPEPTLEHLRRLLALLSAARPDQAVILTSFHQSPLPLALLLKTMGIAPVTGASGDFPGSLLDVRLRPGEDLPEEIPEPLRALAIAEAAGFSLPEDDDGRLVVRTGATWVPWEPSRPYVVVHPGADAPARMWPADRHAAAVKLLAEAGYQVVVTGSPGEAELTARVAGEDGVNLGGRLDLPQLATVLAGASVVVAGNTGPGHLAAAVGTPVASLFAPVVPAVKWAPFGVPVELLGDQDAPCRDTRARRCPVGGHPCLTGVRPQDVVDAVARLASGGRGTGPVSGRWSGVDGKPGVGGQAGMDSEVEA